MTSPNPAAWRQKAMLLVVSIGFFMQTLDSTIVNTALPAMARDLGQSPLHMQAVVIAYALTMAVTIPLSGWLADRLGTRVVFSSALTIFSIGSAMCAYSSTLDALVWWRVVQGFGGAMLLPVGRLAVLRTFPREQYLQALAFVAVPGMIGPLIGPTLGGWLVKVASWHWVFLINVPVGVIGCVAAHFFLINARAPHQTSFDIKGYLLLSVGMVATSLALDRHADMAGAHALMLVLLVVGFAGFVAYGLYANRAPQPLFSLAMFRVHTFSVGLLGNLFARIGIAAVPYLVPLLLQVSLGYTAFEAGLLMLPITITGIFAKSLATHLVTRYGYRPVLVWNTILAGGVMASFAVVTPHYPVPLLILQLGILGGINSIQFTAMNTLTLKDLNPDDASGGNSLFSLVQMLAMSFGLTVGGALLVTFTGAFGESAGVGALPAFRATFACVGLITCCSAWIFAQLTDREQRATDDGDAQAQAVAATPPPPAN
ncbi:multidrug transporter subunit MdtD [Pandoraea apista]|uniref:multidrug transporter subunit MdtD n=1 Tax=Pandoraea apista TaxID=93218 RepID=UPI0006593723|nr:multidrug transporter subunit MdtD [Pandoraea apista]APG58110.1 MFS transporter [Pandoraea apista]CFB60077.1 putative transport protein HsrA [Pandoraea apista]